MTDHLDTFLRTVRAVLGDAPDPGRVRPGEFVRFSTNGKPGNRDGWLKFFLDGRGGCYGCKRQGISESWRPERPRYISPAMRMEQARQRAESLLRSAEQQRQQWAQAGERNARLWAACRPLVPGDAASLYLARRLRGLPLPVPACLRFHPGLDYWHDGERVGTFPALVAAVTSPAGELVALHRTWLTTGGFKAGAHLPPGCAVKKLTGAAGPVLGGCIRLADLSDAGMIGVAEGIETALAASLAGRLPVVAAYSAGAVAAWQWPTTARHIVICADADRAGRDSADKLARRALAAGLRVHVAMPSAPGLDWCDIWASRDTCPDPQEQPQQQEGAAHE